MTDYRNQLVQFDVQRLNAQSSLDARNPPGQRMPELFIGVDTGVSPFNSRSHDVIFRGKMIDELSREEAIEALHQAISRIKAMEWKKP